MLTPSQYDCLPGRMRVYLRSLPRGGSAKQSASLKLTVRKRVQGRLLRRPLGACKHRVCLMMNLARHLPVWEIWSGGIACFDVGHVALLLALLVGHLVITTS